MTDIKNIRAQFPIYDHNQKLVYLDSSATSLKPLLVLNKMEEYYREYGVNIHRGVYALSYRATEEYDLAREKVAKFINADFSEVIFTKNTSDSLNYVALTYGETHLQAGDVVLTSELEHHSSFLPWMKLCERKQAILKYIPLDENGRITVENFRLALDEKVKVVALTYVSNVMGYVTPIKEIIKLAHVKNAMVVVDAAQAVPHFPVDVKDLDCDFLAFSGHKMFGPTGIGVLFGKASILKKMQPLQYGGDMNDNVSKEAVDIKDIPYCFEAGTPMIAEALGLGAAVDFINSIGYPTIISHEKALHEYALKQLKAVKGITLYNPTADLGIMTFNVEGVHPHDAATIFDADDIALRAGHHCAQLVSQWLKCSGTLRASLYVYNNQADVDRFVTTLKKTVAFFQQLEGASHE